MLYFFKMTTTLLGIFLTSQVEATGQEKRNVVEEHVDDQQTVPPGEKMKCIMHTTILLLSLIQDFSFTYQVKR